MEPLLTLAPESIARDRAKQIFRFLKAFAYRRAPSVLRVGEQPWHRFLKNLPAQAWTRALEVLEMSPYGRAARHRGDARQDLRCGIGAVWPWNRSSLPCS